VDVEITNVDADDFNRSSDAAEFECLHGEDLIRKVRPIRGILDDPVASDSPAYLRPARESAVELPLISAAGYGDETGIRRGAEFRAGFPDDSDKSGPLGSRCQEGGADYSAEV
jgi:hypothetical protein